MPEQSRVYIRVINKIDEVIKTRIGTITIWTCAGILIAFKGGKHTRPIVWNGTEGHVMVADHVIDMVDSRQSVRYRRKDFDKLFDVVLSKHNLH